MVAAGVTAAILGLTTNGTAPMERLSMRLIDADKLIHGIDRIQTLTGLGLQPVITIADVKELINAMPTVGGWISVKDRLPEKAGRYLCWFGLNVFCVGADVATFVPEQKAFMSLEYARELWNITHWMPLPEPPKEENNG